MRIYNTPFFSYLDNLEGVIENSCFPVAESNQDNSLEQIRFKWKDQNGER